MTPTDLAAFQLRSRQMTAAEAHAKWIVTIVTRNGGRRIIEVTATNKADAEYRAAYKLETAGIIVDHIASARKA